MINLKKCEICGKEFPAHGTKKYCSLECRQERDRRKSREAGERAKEKTAYRLSHGNEHLTEVLKECKANKMTYAERQIAETFRLVREGKL